MSHSIMVSLLGKEQAYLLQTICSDCVLYLRLWLIKSETFPLYPDVNCGLISVVWFFHFGHSFIVNCTDKASSVIVIEENLHVVNTTAINCGYYLSNITRIHLILSEEECKIIVHTFVISRLDYCNVIPYGLPTYPTESSKLSSFDSVDW